MDAEVFKNGQGKSRKAIDNFSPIPLNYDLQLINERA
jgi:hypothetical protein